MGLRRPAVWFALVYGSDWGRAESFLAELPAMPTRFTASHTDLSDNARQDTQCRATI